MQRPYFLYSVCTIVFAVCAQAGHSQTFQPPKAEQPKVDPELAAALATQRQQANQEDIEVMRRLLNQLMIPYQLNMGYSVNPNYSTLSSGLINSTGTYNSSMSSALINSLSSTNQNNPQVAAGIKWLQSQQTSPYYYPADQNTANWNAYNALGPYIVNNAPPPGPKVTFEGNYLKGYGVNFSAAVHTTEVIWFHPATKALGLTTCSFCHSQTMSKETPAQPAAPTPWEKTRREVMGLPATKDAAPVRVGQVCQPGNLTELILELLAENGHHFSQLAASENLSVALTIYNTRPETPKFTKTIDPKVDDLKNLADLHMKQQKWSEAVKVLDTLIKHVRQARSDEDASEREKELRSLHLKMIVALTASGRDAEAEEWVKTLAEGKSKVVVPKGKSATEAKNYLPSKLMITVSKQLLLDVHSKKITLEQFKKSAEIETFGFPAADKKK